MVINNSNLSPTYCFFSIPNAAFVTNIDVASRDPFDVIDDLKIEMDVTCVKSGADQEKI